MEKLRKLANTKYGAALSFAVAFALIYNPLTKFPFTFIIIVIVILGITLLQDRNLKALNFKNLGRKEILTIFICYFLLELVMDLIFQPLTNKIFKAPADYSAFQFIEGNLSAYLKYLFYMWISAAVGEELLFRAFAFSQLNKLIPQKKYLIVLISAVLFSLPHLYQGISGLLMTFLFGLAFAGIYMKYQNIWINIIVHGLIDSLFLTLSYYGMVHLYL